MENLRASILLQEIVDDECDHEKPERRQRHKDQIKFD
jgi:hypothetical protein